MTAAHKAAPSATFTRMSVTGDISAEGLTSSPRAPIWTNGRLNRFWRVVDCKHVTARFVHDGFPVASIGEVQSTLVDLRNAHYTTREFYLLLTDGGRAPMPGDLILSRNATVGEVAQVTSGHPPFAMGQDVCLLRKRSPKCSTEFLQHLFRSDIVKRQLDNLMVGSTFRRVNVRQVESLAVPWPDPVEQDSIATALSDVDGLIASLDRLIAKKRAIKQAVMQQLLTGKTRLPGFTKPWDEVSLMKLLKVRHGRSQRGVESPDGEYPILASGGVIGRTNRFVYDKPSVLIGRKGTIDEPRFMDSPFWTIDTLYYTEINERADPRFVFYRFCLIDWASLNEASGVPSLSGKNIERQKILCPERAEQEVISSVLAATDHDLAAMERRLYKAKAIKQGMMQALLTGRVRLV